MYLAVQLHSCPYCSSNALVWDYRTGSVVCSSCGSVVDTIYDCLAPRSGEAPTHGRSRFSYTPRSLREIEEARRGAELAERKAGSLKVVRSLPEDVKKLCKYGIELAYRISPSLIEGKCLRSRYAVGYMLYRLTHQQPVDIDEISKMFRISASTARRLMKKVFAKLNPIHY